MLGGGGGGITSVAYDSKSRPVPPGGSVAGAAGGGGGGEWAGSTGSEPTGSEAAANVLRGAGERGKWMAVVVWSVRAGDRRGDSLCRRGWGEMRRMGVVENGGIRWPVFRTNLYKIGTPPP